MVVVKSASSNNKSASSSSNNKSTSSSSNNKSASSSSNNKKIISGDNAKEINHRQLHSHNQLHPHKKSNTRQVKIPCIGLTIDTPRNEMLPFYAGLGLMAVLNLIDWPVVLIIGAGHLLAAKSHNRALTELVEGVESAA